MSEFTTLPIEDLYESTLQSDLGSTDMLARTVKSITGTLTGGNTCYMGINYDRLSKYELVEISAISGQDVTILTRAIQTKAGGTGVAQNHPAGSKVIITHSYKVFKDIATAIASKADGTPSLDGSNAVYVDDTARDTAIPTPQTGMIVTTGGVLQYYSGGIWNDLDVGTPTPDASTTVAGKVEIATQGELEAGTDTGSTGALLSPLPSNLAIVDQNRKYTYAGSTGGTDTAYTATLTPAPSAYVAGQEFSVLMNATNGASPTINFNGLGAKQLVDASGGNIATGALPNGALVDLKYNGTAFQVMGLSLSKTPVTTVYSEANQTFGSSTTRFDITNPSGTTFRYTYDGTGTNPGITALTFPVGTVVYIVSNNFNSNNEGIFTITNSGANFFEVTNASGVVEADKTLGADGVLAYNSRAFATWTKPNGLKWIRVRVIGGGGAGAYSTGVTAPGAGGAEGGYSEKIIDASLLGATEIITLGYGGIGYGINLTSSTPANGGVTKFGPFITCNGGIGKGGSSVTINTLGGTATGGDINIPGMPGESRVNDTDVGGGNGGNGGGTKLGAGGKGATDAIAPGGDGLGYGAGGGGAKADSSPAVSAGSGAPGAVIVEEHF